MKQFIIATYLLVPMVFSTLVWGGEGEHAASPLADEASIELTIQSVNLGIFSSTNDNPKYSFRIEVCGLEAISAWDCVGLGQSKKIPYDQDGKVTFKFELIGKKINTAIERVLEKELRYYQTGYKLLITLIIDTDEQTHKAYLLLNKETQRRYGPLGPQIDLAKVREEPQGWVIGDLIDNGAIQNTHSSVVFSLMRLPSYSRGGSVQHFVYD